MSVPFGILGELDSLDKLTIVPNYLFLALSFVIAYLRPREQTEWLVASSTTYVMMLALIMFLSAFSFSVSVAFPGIGGGGGAFMLAYIAIAGVAPMAVVLLAFLSMLRSRMEMLSGGAWVISFALYLLSLVQEVYGIIRPMFAPATSMDVDILQLPGLWLVGMYFFGIFVVALGGIAIGKWAEGRTPSLAKEHVSAMKSLFGEGAPQVLRFRDGSVVSGEVSAGPCMGMGVVYAVWMALRHLLLP